MPPESLQEGDDGPCCTFKELAEFFQLHPATVREHVYRALRRLGLANRGRHTLQTAAFRAEVFAAMEAYRTCSKETSPRLDASLQLPYTASSMSTRHASQEGAPDAPHHTPSTTQAHQATHRASAATREVPSAWSTTSPLSTRATARSMRLAHSGRVAVALSAIAATISRQSWRVMWVVVSK